MSPHSDFFIGWAGGVPRRHAKFLYGLVGAAIAGFLALAIGLAHFGDDPGPGGGSGDEVTLRGLLVARPYPTLTMPADGGKLRTVMLGGAGKDGAPFDPALDGRMVSATGYMLRRGSLEMLQVGEAVRAAEMEPIAPAAVPLGLWRITGEICDGKCLAGARCRPIASVLQ